MRPWELAEAPLFWVLAAEGASQVDAILDEQAADEAKRKGKG